MSRQRLIPRQHRRFSLPATPTHTPLGFSRSIPEASDEFQKALEDLKTNEPNHAPGKMQVNTFGEFGYNGLNNIQELNESDYVDSDEDETITESETTLCLKSGRRHSSPSFRFTDRTEGDLNGHDKTDSKPVNNDSVVKNYTKLRKEYFIKHGHWPVPNGKNSFNRLRPSSYHAERVKHGSAKTRP